MPARDPAASPNDPIISPNNQHHNHNNNNNQSGFAGFAFGTSPTSSGYSVHSHGHSHTASQPHNRLALGLSPTNTTGNLGGAAGRNNFRRSSASADTERSHLNAGSQNGNSHNNNNNNLGHGLPPVVTGPRHEGGGARPRRISHIEYTQNEDQ